MISYHNFCKLQKQQETLGELTKEQEDVRKSNQDGVLADLAKQEKKVLTGLIKKGKETLIEERKKLEKDIQKQMETLE